MARIPVIRLQVLFFFFIGLLSLQVYGKTTKINGTSDAESRSYGGTAKFQDAGWKVWDNFQDQLAIEAGKGKEALTYGHRIPKQTNSTSGQPQSSNISPKEKKRMHNGESYGMKRQGCNTNLQVSVLPIILAIIAVVSGVIGIFVLWIIARTWFAVGNGISSTLGSGGSHQQGGNGWGQQRQDILGFTRSLQNVDFDQLTKIVSQAVETYHSIFDAKPKKP